MVPRISPATLLPALSAFGLRPAPALVALILLPRCAPTGASPEDLDAASIFDASPQHLDVGSTSRLDSSSADAAQAASHDKVYAHSATTLFQVDPETLDVSVVGDFVWPPGGQGEQMTDIALDRNGDMVGISFSAVYQVDKATAVCTRLSGLQSQGIGFNGLSWVEGAGPDSEDLALVAVDGTGAAYRVDPQSGQISRIGSYGGGMRSSGDLVYVSGAGAFATAVSAAHPSDLLVQLNPATGAATIIGETGFRDIWGLAYWGGRLMGFTNAGEFIVIDVSNGSGELVTSTRTPFWGAGVTTSAPIVL